MVEFFIGLNFNSNSMHMNKIDSFRQRFDSKFEQFKETALVIIPPFSIEFKNREAQENFEEEIIEILDGNFYGINEVSQIEFNGISFTMGKKRMLGLTPIISPDIFHTQEMLFSYLKDQGVIFKKRKNAFNPILMIGRFEDDLALESAIDVAKLEFSSAFVINARSVSLFERGTKNWQENSILYKFENDPRNGNQDD